MADPKCPACGVQGLENIVSADSHERSRKGVPWFNIVYCDACGHVYGVFAKNVFTPNIGPRLVLPDK